MTQDSSKWSFGRETNSYLLAVAFLTRVPVGATHDPQGFAQSFRYYPLIGALIGAAVAMVWMVTSLFLPSSLAAGLAVACGILITGALHEDGLADTADGIGATSDRKQALKIMRDSRIGTFGAVSLIISIGLRWMALSSLTFHGGLAALVIAHAVSRSAIIPAIVIFPNAREDGLAATIAGRLGTIDLLVAGILAGAICFLLAGVTGAVLLAIGLTAGVIAASICAIKLGGYTGDTLGATQQLSEITVMIAATALWAGFL